MRVLQIVPKEIEIVFALSLDDVRKMEEAFCVSEFALNQNDPLEKARFDTVTDFHALLQKLLKDMDNS